ncbi:thermonuclease family protein [Synechococcus sp. CS-1328]|uniref:thermonuclease family protein n=1 Tax=Synechococcus sp. CS-1328 TaxID=2847976 RepID=UPI0037DA0120
MYQAIRFDTSRHLRAACIDAPETGQGKPGEAATESRRSLLSAASLQIKVQTKDRYGRTVAAMPSSIPSTSPAAMRTPTSRRRSRRSGSDWGYGAGGTSSGHGSSARTGEERLEVRLPRQCSCSQGRSDAGQHVFLQIAKPSSSCRGSSRGCPAPRKSSPPSAGAAG